jgi:hypothetical protein
LRTFVRAEPISISILHSGFAVVLAVTPLRMGVLVGNGDEGVAVGSEAEDEAVASAEVLIAVAVALGAGVLLQVL